VGEKSRQPTGQDAVLSSLNVAIDGLNFAKELSSITPAKAVFGSVSILLTMIRVSFVLVHDEIFRGQDTMVNEQDHFDLNATTIDGSSNNGYVHMWGR